MFLAQTADADLEVEAPQSKEEGKAMERVDYGYGTLAEAALTPETGSAMIQSTLPADWSAVVDPASGVSQYGEVNCFITVMIACMAWLGQALPEA